MAGDKRSLLKKLLSRKSSPPGKDSPASTGANVIKGNSQKPSSDENNSRKPSGGGGKSQELKGDENNGKKTDGNQNDEAPRQFPSVELKHFTTFDAENSQIKEAQVNLQKATEELQSTLLALNRSSKDFMPELQKGLDDSALARPGAEASSPTFATLIETLRKNQKDHEKTVTAQIGTFLRKLYPTSRAVLGLTGTVSSAFMPLQITANGLSQILDYAMLPARELDEVVDGLDSLTQDQIFLRDLHQLPGVLEESIVLSATELQTALTVFVRKSILYLGQDYFRRFLGGFAEVGTVKGAKADLIKARNAFKDSISIETYLTVKRKAIANQANKTLAAVLSDDDHEFHIGKEIALHCDRIADTGRWFIEDPVFVQWKSQEVRTLWCPGHPGAGKTYIT